MPANDLIKIDNSNLTTAPFSNDAINVSRAALAFYQQLQAVTNHMAHLTDGSTFTTLETRFGIPSGSGNTVYTAMTTLITTLNSDANFLALMNRVG